MARLEQNVEHLCKQASIALEKTISSDRSIKTYKPNNKGERAKVIRLNAKKISRLSRVESKTR